MNRFKPQLSVISHAATNLPNAHFSKNTSIVGNKGFPRKIVGNTGFLSLPNAPSKTQFYSAIRVESLWGRFSYGGNKHSVILQSGCACAPGLTRPPYPTLLFGLPNRAWVLGADLGSEFPSLTGAQMVR